LPWRVDLRNNRDAETERGHAMAELTDKQRAVLSMLALAPRGYSLPTVMARGFAYEMLQDLVSAGLASVRRDAVGTQKSKLAHLRITAAGRKVIAK
jgi:hypothetical protein